jgi:2-polyprenyl-6-methoxyphenol hydroxylase-like FAD-dependent oxidoreductase
MSTKTVDVIIVGGGIAGCLVALNLGIAGKKVLILEKASQINFNGADFLKPSGIKVLQKYNLLEELYQHKALQRTIIRYYHDSNCIIHYDYTEHTKLGYYIIVPYAILIQAILEKIAALPNVDIWFNSQILSVQLAGDIIQQLTLKEGKNIEATLVVAADGRRSFIRNQLEIPTEEYPYNLDVYMGVFPMVSSVEACNRLYMSSKRRLAYFYPLTPEQFRMAIILPTQEGNTIFSSSNVKFLIKNLKEFVSESNDALAVIRDLAPFIKFSTFHMQALRYFKGNTVLLGGAVLNVHPMTGQGMNAAIEDADILCKHLHLFFGDKHPLEQVLKNYFQERYDIHRQLLTYGDQLASSFHDRTTYLKHFDFSLHGSG